MMKVIETGFRIDDKELKLRPIDLDGKILLYDIYLGEVTPSGWCGSRRTVSACGMALGVPDLAKRLRG